MRINIIIFLLFALGLHRAGAGTFFGVEAAGPLTSITAEERAWLDANPDKLTLYYNTEFPPMEFAAMQDGTFTGLGADLIAGIEQRLNVEFIKTPCSDWTRHLAALESGECAIAPVIVRTADRESFAFFTAPYAAVPVVIITRRDLDERLTVDKLTGRRVAVVSGFATENYIRELARDRFEVVPVRNVSSGLREVSFGQVDAFVENLAVAAWFIEKDGVPNLRVAGNTDYFFAWSIGVSRHYPLLYSAINKALADISPAEFDAWRNKWIFLEGHGWLGPKLMQLLKLAGLFALLLFASLALLAFLLNKRLRDNVARLRQSRQKLLEQTERLEQALREKETLLRELYHRTKNNMQVIRSLLVLQAAASGDSRVVKMMRETESRIEAMALVHQKLYQARDLSRIDIQDYVHDLFDLLVKSHNVSGADIKIIKDVEPLRLLLDIAIPCGLIITELVTNAFKYAFPDNRAAEIRLRMFKPDHETIELHFADNGVGVPPGFDFRQCKTLGIRNILAITESQLQGRVTFKSENGLSCVIKITDTSYAQRL